MALALADELAEAEFADGDFDEAIDDDFADDAIEAYHRMAPPRGGEPEVAGTLDEAGLSEIFALDDFGGNDDPLGLLYLEPGSIEPNAAAMPPSASAIDRSTLSPQPERDTLRADPPALTRSRTLDMEDSAVDQLRELSVLCGEDVDSILQEGSLQPLDAY